MSLAAGERRPCEACGVEVIGAIHSKTGKVGPIVLAASPDGNVLLWRGGDLRVYYAPIGKKEVREYVRDLGVPLRLNHFADCPERARFSRSGAR